MLAPSLVHPHTCVSRDHVLPGLHISALQAMRDVADMPMAADAIVEEGGAEVRGKRDEGGEKGVGRASLSEEGEGCRGEIPPPPPPSTAPALPPNFHTSIHTPPPPSLLQLAIDLLTRDLAGEGLYPLDWALQVGTSVGGKCGSKCGRICLLGACCTHWAGWGTLGVEMWLVTGNGPCWNGHCM